MAFGSSAPVAVHCTCPRVASIRADQYCYHSHSTSHQLPACLPAHLAAAQCWWRLYASAAGAGACRAGRTQPTPHGTLKKLMSSLLSQQCSYRRRRQKALTPGPALAAGDQVRKWGQPQLPPPPLPSRLPLPCRHHWQGTLQRAAGVPQPAPARQPLQPSSSLQPWALWPEGRAFQSPPVLWDPWHMASRWLPQLEQEARQAPRPGPLRRA